MINLHLFFQELTLEFQIKLNMCIDFNFTTSMSNIGQFIFSLLTIEIAHIVYF